jgi:WD40 repeat protein
MSRSRRGQKLLEGVHDSEWFAIRAFPEEGLVVGTDASGNIHLWNVESGERLRVMLVASRELAPLTTSGDGRWLLGLNANKGGELIDLEAGQCVRLLPDLAFNYSSVAFSPNHRWLAYATARFSIRILALPARDQPGECRDAADLAGHSWFVLALRFSPDSRLLASGSTDSTIRLWATDPFEPIGPPLLGHQSGVGFLIFSTDGRTLVSDGDDQTVRWWSVASGQELILLRDASIRSLFSLSSRARWNLAGDRLIWEERQGIVRVHQLPRPEEIEIAAP